jgi:hypothetical protein
MGGGHYTTFRVEGQAEAACRRDSASKQKERIIQNLEEFCFATIVAKSNTNRPGAQRVPGLLIFMKQSLRR